MTACPQHLNGSGPEPVVYEEVPYAAPDDLRRAFRRHAAGVAVVTANSNTGPVGFTVTSLTSVSADPPRVSFNIAHTASSWPAVSQARYVGLHLLGAEQVDLAAVFARSGVDRFAAPTVWTSGPRRVPVIDGCPVWMVGAIEQRVPVGDHSILVAKILHLGGRPDVEAPLLYHDGAFRRLAGDPNESGR